MKTTVPTKLSDKQKFLLSLVPGRWDIAERKPLPEPAAVRQARALITRWDKKQSLATCRETKRAEALIAKAREAVYFASPEKALQIVRTVRRLTKGCQ